MHADAVGGEGGETKRALDQVVARDAGKSHPARAVPALHREIDDAVEREGHGVGGFDRTAAVILHGVDHYPVDALGSIESDLDPIGEGGPRAVVPAAAATPALAGAL